MGQYLPIVVMVALVGAFAGVSLLASKILNPGRPTVAQTAPDECGIVAQSPAPERFPVRFYLVAMIFMYPFTSVFHQLGSFGLIAVVNFAIAVFASFLYLIANGALDWGPVKQIRKGTLGIDSGRTAASTVRRVGLEGREAGSGYGDEDPTTGHEAA